MGVNYNFLYFSGDDSDYNVDSNGIDEELGRGTSSIVFFSNFFNHYFSKRIACFHYLQTTFPT